MKGLASMVALSTVTALEVNEHVRLAWACYGNNSDVEMDSEGRACVHVLSARGRCVR